MRFSHATSPLVTYKVASGYTAQFKPNIVYSHKSLHCVTRLTETHWHWFIHGHLPNSYI